MQLQTIMSSRNKSTLVEKEIHNPSWPINTESYSTEREEESFIKKVASGETKLCFSAPFDCVKKWTKKIIGEDLMANKNDLSRKNQIPIVKDCSLLISELKNPMSHVNTALTRSFMAILVCWWELFPTQRAICRFSFLPSFESIRENSLF